MIDIYFKEGPAGLIRYSAQNSKSHVDSEPDRDKKEIAGVPDGDKKELAGVPDGDKKAIDGIRSSAYVYREAGTVYHLEKRKRENNSGDVSETTNHTDSITLHITRQT
eukprot:g60956.t1